jgi:hypothetical protein
LKLIFKAVSRAEHVPMTTLVCGLIEMSPRLTTNSTKRKRFSRSELAKYLDLILVRSFSFCVTQSKILIDIHHTVLKKAGGLKNEAGGLKREAGGLKNEAVCRMSQDEPG